MRPQRITVAEAFARWAGIDLLATVEKSSGNAAALAAAANAVGIRTEADDTWGDVFSRVLVARIEPALAELGATILTEYPACAAALARRKPSDARVAERFELHACGVELANAYGEETDPAELRRRLEAEMAEKERIWGERYPIDEDFLAALALMPPASGAALGFDRLVMLATGAARIEQVLWTPVQKGLGLSSRPERASAESRDHRGRNRRRRPEQSTDGCTWVSGRAVRQAHCRDTSLLADRRNSGMTLGEHVKQATKTLRTIAELAEAGLVPAGEAQALERVAATLSPSRSRPRCWR